VHAVLRSAPRPGSGQAPRPGSGQAVVTPDDIAERLRAAGIGIESIDTVAPSLEDVFLDVIDRESEKARPGAGRVA
jgi:hypothetical protein